MFKYLIVIAAILVSGSVFAKNVKTQKVIVSVYFDTDKSDIRSPEQDNINEAAQKIKSDKLLVAIIGHADKRLGRIYNLELAERRANAVKDSLMALGIPADQLIVDVSQGKEKPLAPNDDQPEHLQVNRRVDVVLVKPLKELIDRSNIRRHRISVYGGYAPSGLKPTRQTGVNSFQVKEDYDVEAGLSYSYLTPLLNDRLSVTVIGLTNKSAFIGLGLDF